MFRFVTSIVVVAVALIPAIISFDYGGVLVWTQYIATLATVPLAGSVVGIALGAAFGWGNLSDRRRRDSLAAAVPAGWFVALFGLGGYIALQLAPLPAHWVAAVSPGSANAYLDWVAPLAAFDSDTPAAKIPISILTGETWLSLGLWLIALSFAMLGLEALRTRSTLTLFLAVVSIGTAAHAMLATLGVSFVPKQTETSFGGFVNRNNAALFLNLGIASSLGMLIARLSNVSSAWMGPRGAGGMDFGGLVRDVNIWIATICLTLQGIGVAVCGSRGGLLSMLAAGTLALAVTYLPRRLVAAIAALMVPLIIAVGLVISPGMQLRSIERLRTFSAKDSGDILTDNSRLLHWQDSLSAAGHYFPAGSGAGTYEYAYLPYQATGGEQWFRHADNLYFELFVELGLAGLLLIAGVCCLFIVALIRLRRSSDPADQSLLVLGTYAGVAVGVSQFVDFGILIPANALLCVMLGSIVAARSAALRPERASGKGGTKPLRLTRYRTISWPFQMALGGTAVTASILGLLILNPYATTQASAESAKSVLQQFPFEEQRLAAQLDTWRDTPDRVVTEESAMIRAKYAYRIARLGEVRQIVSQQQILPDRAWEMTRPGRRQVGPPPEAIAEQYRASRHFAGVALKLAPLSVEPRAYLIYTDFLKGADATSRVWIEQLMRLQGRNGRQLLRLANLAAHRDQTELVEACCRKATGLSDAFVPPAVDLILEQPRVDLGKAISDRPAATRAAASRLFARLRQGAPRQDDIEMYLRDVVDRLQCEETDSNLQQAACEQLSGELRFHFGDIDRAIVHYEAAIERAPANRLYRAEFIQRLVQFNRLERAQLQWDQAAALFPDDATFNQLKLRIDQQLRSSAPDDVRLKRTDGSEA